jgi:hypothetical protein
MSTNLTILRGDCLTCAKIHDCNEVTIERVKESYTCPLFSATDEAVYLARLHMMQVYGEENAIEAMLDRPTDPDEEAPQPEDEEGVEDDATEDG